MVWKRLKNIFFFYLNVGINWKDNKKVLSNWIMVVNFIIYFIKWKILEILLIFKVFWYNICIFSDVFFCSKLKKIVVMVKKFKLFNLIKIIIIICLIGF